MKRNIPIWELLLKKYLHQLRMFGIINDTFGIIDAKCLANLYIGGRMVEFKEELKAFIDSLEEELETISDLTMEMTECSDVLIIKSLDPLISHLIHYLKK